MTSPATDEIEKLCAKIHGDQIANHAEWERALVMLCENAMRQEDQLAALTTALRENAEGARALETQIKNRAGVRAA